MIDRLISIEKEKKFFQLSIQPHVFFSTGPVTSTENQKSEIPEDWFIYKSSKSSKSLKSSSSHPKKLTHTKFKDERMTRKIITENINSKLPILSCSIHFDQIFKF